MPMIKVETSVSLNDEKRNILKSELGKAITVMGKSENYLMINLSDSQDLYLGGNKLEKGAYVEIKVLGDVDSKKSNLMTNNVCEILEKELQIPSDKVYVSYFGTQNWGWNKSNF